MKADNRELDAEREKQRYEAVSPVAMTWKEIWRFML